MLFALKHVLCVGIDDGGGAGYRPQIHPRDVHPVQQPRRVNNDTHNLFVIDKPLEAIYISYSEEEEAFQWKGQLVYLNLAKQTAEILVEVGTTFKVKVPGHIIECMKCPAGNVIKKITGDNNAVFNSLQLNQVDPLASLLMVQKMTAIKDIK